MEDITQRQRRTRNHRIHFDEDEFIHDIVQHKPRANAAEESVTRASSRIRRDAKQSQRQAPLNVQTRVSMGFGRVSHVPKQSHKRQPKQSLNRRKRFAGVAVSANQHPSSGHIIEHGLAHGVVQDSVD